eukprot:2758352-Ditylum_brightwellii.AAC.1
MMNAAAILSRWKEGVTPSTPSVPLCESTSPASKTTISSELADLANCSHSESSCLAIRQQQMLMEEDK